MTTGGAVRPASPFQVFLVFTGLALRGFGGVLPWAQRVLVEERRWLSREEFVETLAVGQVLPGPNICNLAVMVGDRWFGWRGALAALGGLVAAPAALVLVAAALHGQVADDPLARRVLVGMGAAAGGMILATAVKLAAAQRARWRWLGFGVIAFVAVGLLRASLVTVLPVLGAVAVGAAWLELRLQARAAAHTPPGGGAGP